MEYTLGFVLVVGVGIAAWFAGKGVGKEGRIEEVWDTKAQIVGWISAFLYREPTFSPYYLARNFLSTEGVIDSWVDLDVHVL